MLRKELIRLCWFAVAGLLALWVTADWQLGALVAVLLYLVDDIRSLIRLSIWVNKPKHVDLPAVGGLWGDVFDRLIAMQRRDRKRKKRLARIVSEFQTSTAALPDGVVVLAPRGEIAWFNNAAQFLLGLRDPEDNGQRIANLVRHPEFTNYFSRTEYSKEVEAPSPINANITLSFHIIPYGDGQRLLIVRDVSETRRLEVARRDFVANASHELRTPLTVLHGYLDMMEPESARGKALAAWKTPLDEIRGQVTRMEALVDDLTKLARLESEVPQERRNLIDMPKLLERVHVEAAALSKGRHHIEFEIDPDLCLYGREGEIQSVLSNLVSNAVNYTLAGGVIRVRWWGDNRGAYAAVADSGIGIAEKDLPRITERFYRVDIGRSRSSGGTGLGLSIVKHALERHEARLQVESEPGVGSTFICEFPIQRVHRKSSGSTVPPRPNIEQHRL